MIEVEVHNSLRAFLRSLNAAYWPHHLTMARLVARALRVKRSALIQVGVPAGINVRYRLSYLAPALMWPGPVIIVATESVQQRLQKVEIPQLLGWIRPQKAIRTGKALPGNDFQGLLLTTPEAWLADRLGNQEGFGSDIPTILDGVDDLETWVRNYLTVGITPKDWEELILAKPSLVREIRDARVKMTKAVFQHSANPYECCAIESTEKNILQRLYKGLAGSKETGQDVVVSDLDLPDAWKGFWQRFQMPGQLMWAEIARRQGQFSLFCAPIEVAEALSGFWQQQAVVLIGGALELETEAPIYRQHLGLGDLTCLKFSTERQNELIHLYLPDALPMPNTAQFQSALLLEMQRLLLVSTTVGGLTVLLVSDMPLKAQLASALAAEFGSRVQVEKTCLDDNGILVTSWEFWLEYQNVLPSPRLLVIGTLPIPSLENPLVAGRVAYYKQQRQDWFRLYLLPEALSALQRAIGPVRENQGAIALLDSRVIHRSYGQQILAALGPLARINYLDSSLFGSDR